MRCNGSNISGICSNGRVGEVISGLTLHFFTRTGEEWIEYDQIADWSVSWHTPVNRSGKTKKNKKSATSRVPFSPDLPPIEVRLMHISDALLISSVAA